MTGFDPGKDPKPPVVVSTTKLTINNQGLAISKPGSLAIDLGSKDGQWLRYQLARWIIVVNGPYSPGKPPKSKKVLQLLDDYVEVFPIPNLGQPAYTVNMYRPLPCEFETVKFEIIGKKQKVLQTLKAGETTLIKVPIGKAKTQVGPPDNPLLTYAARWTVKRMNHPNLASAKGYVIQSGNVGNVFINELSSVVSGLNLQDTIGQEFTLQFDIKRAVHSGTTTRQLCLGNAVTNTKFTGQVFASIQAETNLVLNW
ncbi:hypothetical protein [Spirosoma validum]|uniref:Uncharacterized protein n=1 Tax=Spirosoma validum TaxID=2771355 RepID=A0A927B1L4_9BACT|nr:hypothetical protein [Spirosoma validum]MBD2753906.1 hypothetical protein [Spirosoma validum]